VVAAQAQIAVPHGEQCLGDALLVIAALDETPRVYGVAVAVDHAFSERG
jgi:hypothetical protein